MALFQEMQEPCVLMERKKVPDSEGGWTGEKWTDNRPFRAAVVCGRSAQIRAAERQRAAGAYTVTCEPGVVLAYHAVFRRLSDGKIFRVTSNGDDARTPKMATFQFSQVTAEEWELPK